LRRHRLHQAAALAVALAFAPPARAQPPEIPPAAIVDPDATLTDVRDLPSLGLFLGGALTGFLAHESGHLFANLAYGNVPRLEGLTAFGFIPFFAITPRINCYGEVCYDYDGNQFDGGPRGKFIIVSAGYNVQHISSEVILTTEPWLRHRRAPFRKGWLAFNVLLSVGYALSSFTRTEDAHGDLRNSARTAGVQRDVFAAILIAPALLDTYRYFVPASRWAPWVSRGGKATMLGIIATF
jgi:hypothetical protein